MGGFGFGVCAFPYRGGLMQLELLVPEWLAPRSLEPAHKAADRAIKAGADKARRIDPLFVERAKAHVLAYLAEFGVSTGELLTDSCKLAGIRSTDDRHMGVVFRSLLKAGMIRWAGEAKRTKGHASRGGNRYAINQ